MATMKNSLHRFLFILLPGTLLFSGCSLFSNLDGALRLKSYSDNKDQQEAFVKAQDKNFDRLLAQVKGSGLGKYPDKKSILRTFGKPVFALSVRKDDVDYQVWLYRHSTKFFGTEKIYLYFDVKGKLKTYDYTPGQLAAESPSDREQSQK